MTVRARAPGKLVLSGAYSVLEGAPALVAAVDRYAVADSTRAASFVTPEVAEAVRRGAMPEPVGFDAEALREPVGDGSTRKLGLGSSAAILVASLAAANGARGAPVAAALFPSALAIHRAAQGGGSGVDVAASCYGGVSVCRLDGEGLAVCPASLPAVTFEAWACPESASTSGLLARVRAFAAGEPRRYASCIGAAREAAEAVASATDSGAILRALAGQRDRLAELGDLAGAGIVTPAVAALDARARAEGASFYPSGAGGGDIALYAGLAASSEEFRSRARELGLRFVHLKFGAPGVEEC